MLSIGDPTQQELDVTECMRLLATATLGHLGFSQSALPAIQPVTYRLAEGAVLISAEPRSRAASAIRDGVVVLGVDSFGTDGDDEWAVTVVGPVRLAGIAEALAPAWAQTPPSEWFLVLEPVLVSGWRLVSGGAQG